MVTRNSFRMAAVLPLAFVLSGVSLVAHADTTHHKGFWHRHRHIAAGAAGVAGYAYAKHRHSGLMHRHPILTGAAAAAATHHHLKKHN